MTLTTRAAHERPRRCRDDGASSMVEFAFVMVLLLTIVFGIINFGLILSFKQDVTRAAAEGARAAAVAFPGSTAGTEATTATQQAVQSFNKSCGSGGMTCTVSEHDCSSSIPDTTPDDPLDPNCVTVELVYDYKNHPLVVPVPLIAMFLPNEVRAKSSARVNS